MKKYDKELILEVILKVTFIIFIISAILKLFGLNIFNLDLDSKIINYICNFLLKFKLTDFVALIFIFFNSFIILRLCCQNKNQLTYYISAFDIIIINYTANTLLFSNGGYIFYLLFNVIILIFFVSVINRKTTIIKPLLISTIIIIYYIISLFLRDIKLNYQIDFIYLFLLNIDYMILMIMIYYLYLIKVNEVKWNCSLHHLKFLVSDKKIPIGYKLFNLSIILFLAYLNNSVIECIIIITSFLITKNAFGNPFNFNSIFKYFIVSNMIYYILNRVTFSSGISIVISVSLGVMLSYFGSLISRSNEEIKHCRGMKEDILREICVDNNLNSFEMDLLIDFYSNKMSLVNLSLKYNYSKDAIWKKKKTAIKKIKGQ